MTTTPPERQRAPRQAPSPVPAAAKPQEHLQPTARSSRGSLTEANRSETDSRYPISGRETAGQSTSVSDLLVIGLLPPIGAKVGHPNRPDGRTVPLICGNFHCPDRSKPCRVPVDELDDGEAFYCTPRCRETAAAAPKPGAIGDDYDRNWYRHQRQLIATVKSMMTGDGRVTVQSARREVFARKTDDLTLWVKHCAVCGDRFQAVKSNAVYCSATCSKRASRARRGAS